MPKGGLNQGQIYLRHFDKQIRDWMVVASYPIEELKVRSEKFYDYELTSFLHVIFSLFRKRCDFIGEYCLPDICEE